MELRHIRYFVAVAEHANFGRAAAALHTAQPSLSHQIRDLEREVGVPLFERTTRKVELTPAGELYLVECRQLLLQMTAAIEAARSVAKGERGHLRISYVSGGMGAGALPHIFHDFSDAFPEVNLQVQPMPAMAQVEALREGTLHIGFFSAAFRDADFTQQLMWREPLILAMPSSHPFAARASVNYDDLGNQRLMMYSRTSGSQLQNAIIAVLHQMRLDPEIVHQGADAETIIGLVAAGRGISLVPQTWKAFQFPGVTYRAIEPLHWIEPGLAMFWLNSAKSPLIAAFAGSARRTLRENPMIQTLEVSLG